MTENECTQQVNQRLREWAENRKRLACMRDRLRLLRRLIDHALDNPHHKDLDEQIGKDGEVCRLIASLRALEQEQSTVQAFLKSQGFDNLP